MIQQIINFFKKGGYRLGLVETYKSITEHPQIAMDKNEQKRINENMVIYRGNYPKVKYKNSNGKSVERPYHSLNVSKIIARKLAKLVFNEGVDIGINDDEEADAFIQEVFTHSKFRKNFGEELEAGYALGGLVIRPYYDNKLKQIKISYARAGSFFPISSSSNDISEMAFATVTNQVEDKKNVKYTLLEFHLWRNGQYVIKNELYRSEKKDELGYQVGLATLEKYKDLQATTVLNNFSRPLFVHIKLAGKNNKDIHSPLSLGVIDNSKQQIIDINDKYDQFMWEIKQSERKILASDHFMRAGYNSKGEPIFSFDDDTTVFKVIKGDNPILSEFAPDLRSTEYIETINFLLRIIELQSGFSAGTFSFDGQSVKTATEIISENSETYSTRSDNVQIVEEAIKELIISIFELAQANGLFRQPKDLDIRVSFDDGVFQSQDAKLEFYGKASAMGLLSKQKIIMDLWKYSEEEADAMLAQIYKEQMGIDIAEVNAREDEEMFGLEE